MQSYKVLEYWLDMSSDKEEISISLTGCDEITLAEARSIAVLFMKYDKVRVHCTHLAGPTWKYFLTMPNVVAIIPKQV